MPGEQRQGRLRPTLVTPTSAQALVEGGCDWTVANPDGYVKGTAADWADHTGHVEISEWLRRQPAGSGIGTTFSSSADQGA